MATSRSGDTRKAFAALKAHRRSGAPTDMRKAFDRDPKRFATFSARSEDRCSITRNAP
jgi:glucose-6-phosphate isomerase